MALSKEQENWIAEQSLHQVIRQYHESILPTGHPAVRYVERIARRIIDVLDPALAAPNTRWRIFVIESSVANAFVLPSGAIFVFTGILPVVQNEDGLAAIIGHEIAHKIARHGAEKMSFYQFFNFASTILQIFVSGDFGSPLAGILQNLFLFLPFSRNCETEADYIGLMLMAKACYDPYQAIGVWERMQQISEGKNIPAFISTHPSHGHRIEKIQSWMDEANREYRNAGCLQRQNLFKYL